MKFHKICVLGLGYSDLPTVSTFATHGVQVETVGIWQPQAWEAAGFQVVRLGDGQRTCS